MSAVAVASWCWASFSYFVWVWVRGASIEKPCNQLKNKRLRAQLQSVCKPPSKDSQTSEENTKEEEDRDIGKGASASDDDHIDSQPFERGAASNLQIPHLGRIEDCNASLHVQDWQSILSLNVDFYEKALEGCWLLVKFKMQLYTEMPGRPGQFDIIIIVIIISSQVSTTSSTSMITAETRLSLQCSWGFIWISKF